MRSSRDQPALYDPSGDRIHVLNETAEFIWHLCDGKHTLDDIANQIRLQFDVPEDVDLSSDVEHVIAAMLRKDLLLPAADGG